MIGTSWARLSRPTAIDEPVRWNTWYGRAAVVIVLPTNGHGLA